MAVVLNPLLMVGVHPWLREPKRQLCGNESCDEEVKERVGLSLGLGRQAAAVAVAAAVRRFFSLLLVVAVSLSRAPLLQRLNDEKMMWIRIEMEAAVAIWAAVPPLLLLLVLCPMPVVSAVLGAFIVVLSLRPHACSPHSIPTTICLPDIQ